MTQFVVLDVAAVVDCPPKQCLMQEPRPALDVDIAIPDRAQTEPLLSPQWLLARGPKAVPTTPILE